MDLNPEHRLDEARHYWEDFLRFCCPPHSTNNTLLR
jgi:hypothetical protein